MALIFSFSKKEIEDKKSNFPISYILYSIFFCFVFYFLFSSQALAATLSFSPASGLYNTSSNFSVNVYVNSADEALNAASGIVSYPSEKLEAVSISKSGSIFSLWVQEPTIDKTEGKINFEGIVLNPGFAGARGKLITINFRPKKTGTATLSFSSGSVLSNDGKGTNILTDLGGASFIIKEKALASAPVEKETSLAVSGVPLPQKIDSITHPDSNSWYADSNPQLSWSLPSDATGVSFIANQTADFNPPTKSFGVVDHYSYKNVKDGIWYFHLRARNKSGWGEVTHFRFQIDTQKPDYFKVRELDRSDNSIARFGFDAGDSGSGIDHYEISLDNQPAKIWQDTVDHVYETLSLVVGNHNLSVKAVDGAGNYLVQRGVFIISEGAPVAVPSPVVMLDQKLILEIIGGILLALAFWKWFRTGSGNGIFTSFHHELYSQILLLEKAKSRRALTAEESKILSQLKQRIKRN